MTSQRKLGAFALAALMLLALAPDADAQRRRARRTPAPPPPPAVAQHVTIMDGATGAILLCEDCNTPVPPASMAKLMTVLIALERLQAGQLTLDTQFTMSDELWSRYRGGGAGSTMFIPARASVSVRDLLQGTIVVSANDGAALLATGIAGSEENFVQIMNRRAQELGLRTAHFRNAAGLDDEAQRISTADLARLARHIILTYPEFYRTYAQRQFTFNNITQNNRNPLLGAYPGADGVKTGHTDDSGFGLVGSAVQNGQRRIIVFNGLPSMAARNTEAQRLMRSAFNDFAISEIAAAGAQVGEAQVRLGSRRTVPLIAQNTISIGGPRGVQEGLTAHIVYDGPLHPPIAEGQVVARLVIEGPNFQTQEFPLVAGRKVGRANWFSRAFEGLRLTFFGP
ncbi:MAG: D-alanyl-D-alanine carboxypeptidase [Hyphomonadaceae bacterium]|nr:D-alanyl-D-alanine carboxypeptidase [Hyphomonadaceae bacterium]